MTAAVQVSPVMRLPPPLLFVVTFFAGIGLERLVPLQIPSSVAAVSRPIGIGLLACGVLLAVACVGMFLVGRTTIVPHGEASRLITHGPYRLTRNPMYVSLALTYLGVACMLVQPWSLLLLPFPVALVNAIVIPFEEARLREIFGDEFRQYCSQVRRWI
ncbi:MAG TPA: isoprenylcysteine carboxylmethyltransferase family protein [Gammaproteobacteria bacterium]|nr:isoprenylcysteine carboxylmethyltransferase family protein [Gammaproteobacteria bacterium]